MSTVLEFITHRSFITLTGHRCSDIGVDEPFLLQSISYCKTLGVILRHDFNMVPIHFFVRHQVLVHFHLDGNKYTIIKLINCFIL